MKKFQIKFVGYAEIESDSFNGAIGLFHEKYPEMRAEYIDDDEDNYLEIIGYCENTGVPILETDEYEFDSEGIYWLKSSEYEKE